MGFGHASKRCMGVHESAWTSTLANVDVAVRHGMTQRRRRRYVPQAPVPPAPERLALTTEEAAYLLHMSRRVCRN